MLKVFAFLFKKPGMDTAEFTDYYENHHVPFICSLAEPPRVYKRNYVVRGYDLNREDAAIGFDVVTELVFDDRKAYEAWLAVVFQPGNAERVAADEAVFLDRARTLAYTIDERITNS